MKTKSILLLIFLVLTRFSIGQVEVPQGYESAFAAAKEKADILLKSGFDFVIPPQESVQLIPSSYDLQQGNWAGDYLETNAYEQQILSRSERKVIVFIYDTAGKLSHKNLPYGIRNDLGATYTGEASPDDGHSHATHVAGCMMGYSDNIPLGVARILAKAGMLRAVPFKVLTNSGAGKYPWVTKALLDGTKKGQGFQEKGYFVIHNLSLGGGQTNTELEKAILQARQAGQLVIIASGNNSSSTVSFPARAKGAWAIGALQRNAEVVSKAAYSNCGAELFMATPGSYILSTVPGDKLAVYSGTSMATPHMSGIAAILASINPKASANQIERALADLATDLYSKDWDKYTAYGAPLISKFLEADLTKYPDLPLNEGLDNPEDPNEAPSRERRVVSFWLEDYNTIWKTRQGKEFNKLTVALWVSFQTDLYDEHAFDTLHQITRSFFNNRAFLLKDEHGFSDATYWARHFYEMLLKKKHGVKVKVEQIIGYDELGRTAIQDRGFLTKLGGRVKTLGNGTSFSFSLKFKP